MEKTPKVIGNDENTTFDLKQKMVELVKRLSSEKIIELNESDVLTSQTFDDIVLFLRDKLQETYPQTKLKRCIMKSVHNANGFSDEKLKQSAFILDEIEQYLTANKFLNHNVSVNYFNNRITTAGFVINSTTLKSSGKKSEKF